MNINKRGARSKWGRALDFTGFQIVPNILLAQQGQLGLSATEVVILLHLNRYWWTREGHPYPSPARIADDMGLHVRSVQRYLSRLEDQGWIRRLEPRPNSAGKIVHPISLMPLSRSLASIASDLLEERRLAKQRAANEDQSADPIEPPSDSASDVASKSRVERPSSNRASEVPW